MLFASYIAYKERLSELSIESFNECKKRNESNDVVKTVSSYYIAKNYYLMGQYNEAILHFTLADGGNLGNFGYLLHAIRLNKAITYLKMNNIRMFRETVNGVIQSDKEGKYSGMGRAMLEQIR
jgi:tetratricopeptide (TPR) repeat protein